MKMSRHCPKYGCIVIYADCLECEDKICKRNVKMDVSKKVKIYFEKIDTLMSWRGYELKCIKNEGTEDEERTYRISPLDYKYDKISVIIRKGKKFCLFYCNTLMKTFLQTEWLSPINDEDFFTEMLSKFKIQVDVLRMEYEDWE